MIKLIMKLGLVSLIVIAIYGFACWQIFGNRVEAVPDIYNKKNKIIKQMPSPKIIIMGGSNTLFGYDSTILENGTGMPVVNMGLTLSFGLKFMMENIKPFLHKGDIVVLAPEYELMHDRSGFYGNNELIHIVLNNIDAFDNFKSPWQLLYFILRTPEALIEAFFKQNLTLNIKKQISGKGDLIWDEIAPEKKVNLRAMSCSSIPLNKTILGEMVSFRKQLEAKGVRLFITPPYIPENIYLANKIELDKVYQQFAMAGFVELSLPETAIFSDLMFYDTAYHLNAVGRIVRSEKTARDLRSKLGI